MPEGSRVVSSYPRERSPVRCIESYEVLSPEKTTVTTYDNPARRTTRTSTKKKQYDPNRQGYEMKYEVKKMGREYQPIYYYPRTREKTKTKA